MNSLDLQQAIQLHRAGQLDAARKIYQQMVDGGRADPRIVSLLGQLQMQMGDHDQGIANLARAADSARDDTRINLSYVRGLAAAGRAADAAQRVGQVLQRDEKNPEAWATLAAVQRHLGQHRNELESLQRAIKLAPQDVPMLLALANAQAANHRIEDAVATLRQAASLAPDNVRILNNLGALLMRLNRNEEAIKALQDSLKIQPDYPTATQNLAMALHRSGRLQAARAAAERALSLAPNEAETRAELGSILMALGDLAGAEAAFLAARESHPANQRVMAGLAELRERQGQPDAGLQLLSELVEQNEASTDTRLAAASLARRCGRRDTALEYLAPLLDDDHEPLAQLDVAHRRRLAFLLGDVYDASADCKQALRYYDIGNQCVDGRFDADRHYRFIDNIINHYSEPPADTGAPRTTRRLFIVGMPRSGTSLLETMLSRHPDIHACGELALLGQLLGDVGFPDAGLSDSDFARLAEQYCTGVAAPPGARWMTDKMPLNFQYVGAISHMLPDAHIIHCERDPRDTMLSCYFQNFLDPALDFSFDLDDLSHYYRNYQRLMRHWHDNFPAHISSLKYEDLVEDPGFVMQPLLERLGLPWDDHVLQPQDSGRYVSTASHAQVREPIHRRSVGRFARYRPFLDERAEIFDALA